MLQLIKDRPPEGNKRPEGGGEVGDQFVRHEVSASRLRLFRDRPFSEKQRIAEYAGEKITRKEAMRRMRRPSGKRISELDADCYIDGSVDGNETQYINHSCDPNADVFVIGGSHDSSSHCRR